MTRRTSRLVYGALLLLLLGSVCGCAAAKLHPWDRDLLAEKKMSYIPDPMLHAIDQHIYFSEEGSTGGAEVTGGGCGCN